MPIYHRPLATAFCGAGGVPFTPPMAVALNIKLEVAVTNY